MIGKLCPNLKIFLINFGTNYAQSNIGVLCRKAHIYFSFPSRDKRYLAKTNKQARGLLRKGKIYVPLAF